MNGRYRRKGFMKGNRMLPAAVVTFLVLAIALTVVFIWKQPLAMILAEKGNAAVSGTSGTVSGSTAVSAEAGSETSAASNAPSAASSRISVDSINSKSLDSASFFSGAMFVGDSITLGIKSYRILSTASIYASNGMSTYSALKSKTSFDGSAMRLSDAVAAKKPSKIFLLLGSNDETYMTEDSFIGNYGEIIDLISKYSSSSKIYVQSVFPVTSALQKKSSRYSNTKIDSFNQALKALCTEKKVTFVDTGALFRGADGCMKTAYSGGGVNIKRNAYYIWLNDLSGVA